MKPISVPAEKLFVYIIVWPSLDEIYWCIRIIRIILRGNGTRSIYFIGHERLIQSSCDSNSYQNGKTSNLDSFIFQGSGIHHGSPFQLLPKIFFCCRNIWNMTKFPFFYLRTCCLNLEVLYWIFTVNVEYIPVVSFLYIAKYILSCEWEFESDQQMYQRWQNLDISIASM